MKKNWQISILISLLWIGVWTIAVCGQQKDLDVNPILKNTVQNSTEQDDELKTQQAILAELRKLRAEKAGWLIEKTGLEGLISVKDKEIALEKRATELEKKRGDFFEQALEKASKIDVNSQKIDANSQEITRTLRQTILDLQNENRQLEKDLASARSNYKWIGGGSAILGGILGYKLKTCDGSLPFVNLLREQNNMSQPRGISFTFRR